MKPKTIHATSVVIEDSGVLIVGNSGLGKSDLALRLIDSGATLISDDITICKKVDDSIFLFPPLPVSYTHLTLPTITGV